MRSVTFFRSILFFSLILFFSNIYPQENVEFKTKNFKDDKDKFFHAVNNMDQGDVYFKQRGGAFITALRHYHIANDFNPDNAMLNYKIGVCYLHSAYKDSAMQYLEKALKLDNEVATDIHYYLGWSYHLKLDFDKAIEEYEKFGRSLSGKEQKKWAPEVEKRVKECKYGKQYIANPVKIEVENLGDSVNSPYPDYRPLISADESMIIFTSRRESTTGGKIAPYDLKYFEDIYVSYNVDGKWTKAENIGKPLNTFDHDAAVGLSPDGQQLFLYKGRRKGGDILLCELLGDAWSYPKALPTTINTDFRESSANFSYDGNTLFFVSNKEEGTLGGRDIYKCTKDEKYGKWKYVENLGEIINTEYEEASIFVHPDGRTLYFSSQGHSSMGGFDIFKATMIDDSTWGKPVNLGYPINTPDDDVFFVTSASGKHGYYSSIRKEGCGEKDIYRITFVKDPVKKVQEKEVVKEDVVRMTLLKGTVRDAVTLEAIEAEIEIVDNTANRVITIASSNSKTGKFLVSLPSGKNYGIAVKADDYLFHSENFNLPDTAVYQEVNKDILLNKIVVGSKIVLKNIFFDFDKATLRPESVAELNRVMELLDDYSTIKIEISGHTDNKGSLEYNTQLSESRAKAVVDYLIEHDVSKDRLSYKGYAFTEPIADNETEEGRQLNRRVEFKILSKD